MSNPSDEHDWVGTPHARPEPPDSPEPPFRGRGRGWPGGFAPGGWAFPFGPHGGPGPKGGPGRHGPGTFGFAVGRGPGGRGGPGPFGPFADLRQWLGGWGGWEGGRGQRARRGDVRAAALALLSERPMNGYQIIQEIKQRSSGMWTASSGSVYPALQQLEDEGLIVAGEHEGRRAFSLTDAGRKYVEENPDELAAPWESVAESTASEVIDLREAIGRTMGAVHQVISAGTDEQRARAVEVLNETRKALYRILADDTDDEA